MAKKYPSFKRPTAFISFGSKKDRMIFIRTLILSVIEVVAVAAVLLLAYFLIGRQDFNKSNVVIANLDSGYTSTESVSVPTVIRARHLLEDSATNEAEILTLLGSLAVCDTTTDLSTGVFYYDGNSVSSDVWAAICFVDTAKCARDGATQEITVGATTVAYTDSNLLYTFLDGGCYSMTTQSMTYTENLGDRIASHAAITSNTDVTFNEIPSSYNTAEKITAAVSDGTFDGALIIESSYTSDVIASMQSTATTYSAPVTLAVDTGFSFIQGRYLRAAMHTSFAAASKSTIASALTSSTKEYDIITASLDSTTSDSDLTAAVEDAALEAHFASLLTIASPLSAVVPSLATVPSVEDIHPANTYGAFLFAYLPFMSAAVGFIVMAMWFFPLWRTQGNGKIVMGPLIAMFGKISMYFLVSCTVTLTTLFIITTKGGVNYLENGGLWWLLATLLGGCLAIGGVNAIVYGLFGTIGAFINVIISFFMFTSANTMLPQALLPQFMIEFGEYTPMYHAVCLFKNVLFGSHLPEEKYVHWIYLGSWAIGGLLIGTALQVAKVGRRVSAFILPPFFGSQSVANSI